jgi:EF hand
MKFTSGQNERSNMKTNKLACIAAALGLAAFSAVAQDNNNDGSPGGGPGNHGGPRGHHPPFPLIGALDVNHDHVIDSNEIANASAVLLTLDKNGDGQLTADEYLPPLPPGVSADSTHRPPAPAIVKALDANGDGVIDASEIANAPAALKSLDKNGDGQLTPDEFIGKRPAPPQGGDAGGPHDGPPPGDQ